MIVPLLILSIVAQVYGKPQENPSINSNLHTPDDRCPPSGTHYLLPHEYDCAKFYYCEYGQRFVIPRDCAPGTHFSYERQVCVHAAQSGCTSPGQPTTSTAPPSTSTTTSAPSSTTTPGGGFLPNGCPSNFNINWHLPHETDCGKFYHCVHGHKLERSCSPGLHFNPIKQVCDWPANAGCVSGGGSSTNAPSSTVSTTSSIPPSTTTTTTSAPSSTTTPPGGGFLPNGCPSDFHINWHLPHETDCGKFYHCVHRQKVERNCSPGLHFNPIQKVCDWPANAGCVSGDGSSTNAPSSTVSTTSTTSPSTTSTTTSAPSSTTTPPGGGLLPNGCPSNFNINWHLPHETDCGKFYHCVHGHKLERSCSPGLHFNPIKQVCDWPANAGCVSGGGSSTNAPSSPVSTTSTTPSSTTSTTTSAPSSTVLTTSTTPPSTTSPTTTSAPSSPVSTTSTTPSSTTSTTTSAPSSTVSTTSTTPSSTTSTTTSAPSSTTTPPGGGFLPNGCPSDFDINWHLPHETDCGKFYHCVHGQKVERSCYPGLHFNPIKQICDWPADAGCESGNGGGQQTSTTPSSTISTTSTAPSSSTSTTTTSAPSSPVSTSSTTPSSTTSTTTTSAPSSPVATTSTTPPSTTSTTTTSAPSSSVSTTSTTPSNTTSTTTTTTSAPSSPVSPTSTTPSSTISTTTSAPSSTTTPPGGGLLPNGCPSDFDVNWHLPHETDCGKFYHCVHGQKMERSCYPGLHFNPIKQICDWPADAGCESGSGDGQTTSTTLSSTISTTSTAPSSTTPSPTTISTTSTTPSSTTPSPTTISTTSTAPSSTTPSPSTISTTSAPTSPTPPGGGGNETDRCKDNCHVPHWAHETDCDKFWHCVGNQKVLGICSEGLHFNEQTQTCDFMCNVGCERKDVQTTAQRDGLKVFMPWDKVDKLIKLSKRGEMPQILDFSNLLRYL